MTHARSQAELVTIRKLAQEIAANRKERVTSVHLLAAIARDEGPAGEILRERRLDEESLLKASRAFDDDGPDPIGRLLAAARDMAARSPAPEPGPLHLLLALLADRAGAAHRSLVQAGIDLARLRAAVMPVALGVVARRSPLSGARSTPPPAPSGPTTHARAPLPRGPARRQRIEPSPLPALPDRKSAPMRGVSGSARVVPIAPARPASTPPPAQPGVAVPLFPPPPRALRKTSATHAPEPIAAPGAELISGERSPAERPTNRPAPASASSSRPPSPSRFALDRALFPVLATLGHNLTLAAAEGTIEPIIGRDEEIEQALDVLAKRHANNPCLVGPPGVGKTSVARGLAQRFAEGDGEGRVLVELVVSELIAGTGTRGALAERIAAIRTEVREAEGRVVLFVDEAHELFGAGGLDEAIVELRVALSRGEIRLVCATTPEEYRRSIEADGALARRFTPIEIEEPIETDAFLLLRSVAVGLGRHHGLSYADEAIAAAVAWSIRYLPGRALPDKALSILDLSGARAKRKLTPGARVTVGPPDVASVVAEIADLPVERLLETDRERMLALEKLLAERVVGHSAAIERIARVLRRNAAGLRGRRPIGSFLLLGPTGVGKTETAKAIAECLFHSPDAMTRLDFSEYAEAHAVARLVGAPPGYVGHEAGGQLTEAVRRRPYQVILLDEIEKAHRDVLEAFLQVFDEGRLTDGRGRRVDFTNAVIVMTSNLGAAEAGALKAEKSVGFSRAAVDRAAPGKLAEVMIAAARVHLPPELYNRIDEVLCFGPLSRAEVAEIARRLLEGLEDSLSARGVRMEIEPEAIDALLAAGGFDADLGARPMKRAIARLVENPLAELILRGDLEDGAVAMIGVEKGEIVVDALPARRAAAG